MTILKFRHIKTGNYYYMIAELQYVTDNAFIKHVVYCNEEGVLFSRTKNDFKEKFEYVNTSAYTFTEILKSLVRVES